jgi:hypothetical protein
MLSPYAKSMYSGLKPILEKFDPNKLDVQSKIEILKQAEEGTLHIDLVPLNKDVFGLNLYASASQCILGYCYSEQLECHTNPEENADYLKTEIISAFEKYLQGVTVIHHYNQSGKIFKSLNYWGLDTENQEHKFIGTNALLFAGFSKTARIKKITYHFNK